MWTTVLWSSFLFVDFAIATSFATSNDDPEKRAEFYIMMSGGVRAGVT